jgi:hypothetical protein
MHRARAHIRPYHPGNLDALYRICLLTPDDGQDATSHFHDPGWCGVGRVRQLRQPPHPVAEVEVERGGQDRPHEEGVEQDAEGDREANLGQGGGGKLTVWILAASFHTNLVVVVTVATVAVTYFVLGAGNCWSNTSLVHIGAYLGLIVAAFAVYLSTPSCARLVQAPDTAGVAVGQAIGRCRDA